MRERMLWVGIGVLSLLLAAALGLATSSLTEAPVGLSAEPVSAGEALAPAPDPAGSPAPEGTARARRSATPKPTPDATRTPAPTRTATPQPTGDPRADDVLELRVRLLGRRR